jgi:U4/U6.U5 tri-snRNP component SNU23
MSNNLNYKQVAQVSRRKWDSETYEKRAQDRRAQSEEAGSTADGNNNNNKNRPHNSLAAEPQAGDDNAVSGEDDHKEEFQRASQGAVGPEGSDRAFLKARRGKVDIDTKIGTTELVSAEAAATSSTAAEDGVASGVVKTGIGWHCKVCDCFLKDSLTYLDHINGRKHQRKLGFSMRVERTSKDSLMNKLSQLTKRKEEEQKRSEVDPAEDGPNYDAIVIAKDKEAENRKEERANKRRERKQRLVAQKDQGEEDEELETAEIDPGMAAMMGFSGFGGGK